MKIIHMSDLHLGYRGVVAALREVEALAAAVSDPAESVIVISGDLVHDGREENFRAARGFVDELRAKGFTVLAAPGNHDYRSSTDPLRRKDEANVARFRQEFFGDDREFPRLDLVPASGGPEAIAFIGLDTMREVFRRRDAVFDRGEFGPRQLSQLTQILARDDVRACGFRVLYFHHNPFGDFPLPRPGGALAFRRLLMGTIAGGVTIDALLYGHTHFGRADHGLWGIPRCYNAGTSTGKRRPRIIDWIPAFQPIAATRCIDLSCPPGDDFVIG